MPEAFLDTNILLRHLLNDDPIQSPRVRGLIEAIEQGRETVWTTDLTIAEVVFVLASKRGYNLPRADIARNLLPLLNLPGIKLANKRIYGRVFDLYAALPIDFIDCYHAALIDRRKNQTLYSFDPDFDEVPGIIRREP